MPFIQASGTTAGGGGSISVTDGVTTVNPATIVDFTTGATVSNAGGGQANVAIAAGSFAFSPTAAKTANYSAAASEWVAVDPSGGNFNVTLPAAPANGTIVGIGHVAASGTVTVVAGAGDTIGGGLQTAVSGTRRAFIYTYRASDKVWQGETPLSTAVLAATAFDGSIVTHGTSTAVTLATGTLDAVAAAQPPVADWSNASNKITSVKDPTAAQDAATKNYVDSVAAGLDFKQACDLATTGALAANTYANGALGVGATLTANGNAALTVDSVAVTANQRLLVKNEAAQSHNGIYVVTQTGSGILPYILTRATDYNQTSEIQAGDAVFVTAGATLADTLWVMTTTGAITVGTTAIVFSQFGSAPNLAAVLAVGNSAGSTKITNLTNGSGAQDAAAFGQIPTVLPGTILGLTFYAPTTPTSYSVTATSLTAVDTTNLKVTFTTAAAGAGSTQVVVRLQAGRNGNNIFMWGLTGTGAPTNAYAADSALTAQSTLVMDILVTGLTASTSYTWNFACCTNTGTQTLTAGSSTGNATNNSNPAMMTVLAGLS